MMEYEPQKYLHKTLLYHHLYLGHTHTKKKHHKTSQLYTPGASHAPQVWPQPALLLSPNHKRSGRLVPPRWIRSCKAPVQGQLCPPAVHCSDRSDRHVTETRPRIQPLFPSLKEVFKARHGLQDEKRCYQMLKKPNRWEYHTLAIPAIPQHRQNWCVPSFFYHLWQLATWRCSRSMGLPLSHNSLRLLAELIQELLIASLCWRNVLILLRTTTHELMSWTRTSLIDVFWVFDTETSAWLCLARNQSSGNKSVSNMLPNNSKHPPEVSRNKISDGIRWRFSMVFNMHGSRAGDDRFWDTRSGRGTETCWCHDPGYLACTNLTITGDFP